MSKRIIQSPGVEIIEKDLSERIPTAAGTTIYATGFSDQGPVDEVIKVSDINEFEQIYGLPKTPAEKYFYHTVKACATPQANVLVNRLPYGPTTGDGFGSYVSVLAYPAIVTRSELDANGAPTGVFTGPLSSFTDTLSSDLNYFIGAPRQFTITQTDYSKLLAGSLVNWSDTPVTSATAVTSPAQYFAGCALLVVNKGQTTINNQGHGYYIALADNTAVNPASAYNSITEVYTTSLSAGSSGLAKANLTKIPNARLDFVLSADPGYVQNSISQLIEEQVVSYDINSRFFDDTLNVGVFKLRQSVFSNNQDSSSLNYVFEEAYNGSIGYDRVRPNNDGPAINFSLENVEVGSRNIDIIVNPFVSNSNSIVPLRADGTPKKKIRVLSQQLRNFVIQGGSATIVGASAVQLTTFATALSTTDALFALGAYTDSANGLKVIGDVATKVDRALEGIRNADLYNVDILVEGGLGTIYTTSRSTSAGGLSGYGFNDTVTVQSIEELRNTGDLTNNTARQDYTTLFNKFANFAGPPKEGGRGDVLFIADPLRQILVTGKESKILSDKTKIFTRDVYWALRHQFELVNTSYAAAYANFFKVLDNASGNYIYVPPSGFVAAKMVSTDVETGPWGAPAGFNRGIVNNVADVAIAPNQHQRDSLYQINLNPIATFADQGIVVFGQKTLLRKPSAFDRVNVRRTFLYLEKVTKSVMNFFVFENNTVFTRSRILNTLVPYYERVKAADGLYDFLIVCDERNNTPEVIDNNELIVDIYLKPVRTAEFIRVNFYATRTDANFEELVGS